MQSPKYLLGGKPFSSKEEIRRYAKALLRDTTQGQFLSREDLLVVADLLRWHPDAKAKFGSGIRFIQVIKPIQKLPGKCFVVHRTDGSTVDFSYRVCLEPSASSLKRNAIDAFRAAILPQTIGAKKEMLETMCNAQGDIWSGFEQKWLSPADVALDHYPRPFADILDEFLVAEDLTIESVQTYEDSNYTRALADKKLAMRWQLHHRINAQYRLISSELNSKLGRHKPEATA